MSDSAANSFSANSYGRSSSQSYEMMAATLDMRGGCYDSSDWRHSLEPQTPSAQQVDVLHEFIASWDDELLGTGAGVAAIDNTNSNGNGNGGGPMMALLQSTGAVTSVASPRNARLVHAHAQSPLTINQKVYASKPKSANGTSPASFTSGSEKVQPEEVVPVRKRIRRKVEIAQLCDEGAFLEKKLYELCAYWKSAPEKLQQQ